jgi:thiamine-monophosphate kinase
MRVPSGGKRIDEVGEFDLINTIKAATWRPGRGQVEVGIGDDAAVWRPRPNRRLIATTDMLVENVDFRAGWFEWKDLGYKSLAANLSDVAAMGAVPRLALVTLGLLGSETDRDIVEFYRGVGELANQFNLRVVVGDLSQSPSGVIVSVTVLGESGPSGQPLLSRSAAKPGDVLAVTGSLGLAASGLRVLQQDLRVLDGNPAMVERFTRPVPRIREGRLLVRSGVRAAMDISDGLLGDLPKLCADSHVSATIDLVRLPIPHAIQWAFSDWFDLALRGGEDFELLFTASPLTFARVTRSIERAGLRAPTRIGVIDEAGPAGPSVRLRGQNGLLQEIEPGAFAHFQHSV